MTTPTGATRAEICVVACAEAWRGDGETLAATAGTVPALGARLARLTFSPHLLLTDGEAMLLSTPQDPGRIEGWLPYRKHLSLAARGKRHMMMGAAQLDRYGNQNISCVGDWARPRRQLLGARGAPSNTVNHPVSYWVPRHSPRVFVPRVDMVSGVGYDRAAAGGPAVARFHGLRRVVTDLAVLDFATPDHRMRLASVHPGVGTDQVREQTGFALAVDGEVPTTREPTEEELRLLREVLDPHGTRDREVRT
ncbi:CoA-transferase subunit beta [Streptomyces smyrnaeus]|uniref:CoA-transferase subunit beta n=1 Tax=Streptomyces TaxID=1883 RepID=UPI000C17D732|nr:MULTISPECIES: CoA-transferase [unclassified Streptomyces]MBQ0868020.1 CoA-transferase [Streptomyces sp. RK75]MBQ1119596.1 CoA-transferase [Streptomyces sp. B15]MBQ1161185.1 CoA-transferase [Streptomyces sp. A73]